MLKSDIRKLSELASIATSSLLPVASGTPMDSHGGTPEPMAQSVARGLAALIEAGDLARRLRDDATKS